MASAFAVVFIVRLLRWVLLIAVCSVALVSLITSSIKHAVGRPSVPPMWDVLRVRPTRRSQLRMCGANIAAVEPSMSSGPPAVRRNASYRTRLSARCKACMPCVGIYVRNAQRSKSAVICVGEDYAVFAIRNIIGQDIHEFVAGSTSSPLVGSSRISSFASRLNATASILSFICMLRDRSLIFLFRPSPKLCLRYVRNRLWSQ